jgi:hypothetical protein
MMEFLREVGGHDTLMHLSLDFCCDGSPSSHFVGLGRLSSGFFQVLSPEQRLDTGDEYSLASAPWVLSSFADDDCQYEFRFWFVL